MKFLKSIAAGVRSGLAITLMRPGNYQRAAKILEPLCLEKNEKLKEVGNNPDDPGGRTFIDLGHCYFELGRFADAVRLFSHVYQVQRTYYQAHRTQWGVRENYAEFVNVFSCASEKLGEFERARQLQAEGLSVTAADVSSQ